MCLRSPSAVTTILALVSMAIACPIADAAENSNFEQVLARKREALLASPPPESARIDELAGTLNDRGQWPGINYSDQSRGSWKTREHMLRVNELALALVHPDSPRRDDANLEKATLLALDHWLEHRYRNPNWWYNSFGIPLLMSDVIVLLGPRLNADRREAATAVLSQSNAGPIAKSTETGANLLWRSGLAAIRSALEKDANELRDASRRIAGEIRISDAEGIKPDFSFHQHGARLQSLHYGDAFLANALSWAWVLHDTPWALPPESNELLANLALEGTQWMARGIYTVPGPLDRSVSRPGTLSADRRQRDIPLLQDLLPDRTAAFAAYGASLATGKPAIVGYRHFPFSDFSAYHQPTFSFFVKTPSTRTRDTESMNGENLKRGFLGSGDAYIIRDGTEYTDLMPVWDWRMLPGMTASDRAEKIGKTPFNGGLSDGTSGITATHYELRRGDTREASVRKSWICHGGVVVILASGDPSADLRTALDQNRLRGPVTILRDNATDPTVIPPGSSDRIGGVNWIHHAGLLTAFQTPATVTLQTKTATGSWHEINEALSDESITEAVYHPIVEHDDRALALIVVDCPNPADASTAVAATGVRVIHNDNAVQAVAFADGSLFAAFFEPGELKDETSRTFLTVDRPCLVMRRADGRILAADPTMEGGSFTLGTGTKKSSHDLPAHGAALSISADKRVPSADH